MKKIKALFLLLMLIAVVVTVYSKKTIDMNFSASDVECLEVHHMLYADDEALPEYEKKVVIDSNDIENANLKSCL